MLERLQERLGQTVEDNEQENEQLRRSEARQQLDQKLNFARQQEWPVEMLAALRVARDSLDHPEEVTESNLERAETMSAVGREDIEEMLDLYREARQEAIEQGRGDWSESFQQATEDFSGPARAGADQLNQAAQTHEERGLMPARDGASVQQKAYIKEVLADRVRNDEAWNVGDFGEWKTVIERSDASQKQEIYDDLLTAEHVPSSMRALLAELAEVRRFASDEVIQQVQDNQTIMEAPQEAQAQEGPEGRTR